MDYFKEYFEYAGLGVSEPPAIFHRWAAISIIGTALGRQTWFPFGHSEIYPNQYIMFMGSPGARKSTAINIGAKLLKAAGYKRFASDRTSKERFLMDIKQYDSVLEIDDLEALTLDEPAETCVIAEEFTDFIGANNMEFITMLTKLWDCPPEYTHPKIHGQDVLVTKPTVNILSGNTKEGFALAFPAEALGNGFLSRMILVQGETTGRLVTFPESVNEIRKKRLADHLLEIMARVTGQMHISAEAEQACDRVYKEYIPLDDHRFRHYATRRFTHLLKLCIIHAAADLRTEITAQDVIRANTVLHYTELKMPKALGEFGKSKYSDITNNILEFLEAAHRPITMQEIWKRVSKDLNKMAELGDIMRNLKDAERVQIAKTKSGTPGFLPLKRVDSTWAPELLEEDWINEEEKLQ